MAFCASPVGTPEIVRRRRKDSRERKTNRAGRVGTLAEFRRRSDSQLRTVMAMYLAAIRPGHLRTGDKAIVYGTRMFWTCGDERTLGALPALIARADVRAPLCLPALPWYHMQADLVQVGQCFEILAGLRTEYYVGKKDTPWTEPPVEWLEPYCRTDVFRPTKAGLKLPSGWIPRVHHILMDVDATYHLSRHASMDAWWDDPECGHALLQREIVGPLRVIGWPVERLPAMRSPEEGSRRRKKRKKRSHAAAFDQPTYWFTNSWDDRDGVRGSDALQLCVNLFQKYLPSIKSASQKSLFEVRIKTYQSLASSSSPKRVETRLV